jgi:amphi-Trp domain-containing protein
MKRQKNSFRHSSLQSQQSIQSILKALTKGIAAGEVTFSDDDDSIRMRPEGLLNLKLTAMQEDGRNRITLRIGWENQDAQPPKKKALRVRSK